MCLARPRFPVLFSLRGFLGQVVSGYPGTLSCSFSLISLCCSYVHFLTIIKVGYGVTPRPVFVGYFRFLFFY